MTLFHSGAVLGGACAAVVAVLGILFFHSTPGQWINIGCAIRTFARGVLGVVSVVLAVVGIVLAAMSGAYQFYFGWLVTYLAGLVCYFVLRYKVFKIS
jgi:uncharacterized membrane protein SirB2